MTIAQDANTLTPGTIVELFEIDLSRYSAPSLRFHNGVNELGSDVVWQGNTYVRFPIETAEFAASGQGTLPRPKLAVANPTGMISALCKLYGDLVGCQLTRRRTLLHYLDAVNFAEGNPSADPTEHFPDEVFRINQKLSETREQVSFELAAAWDAEGKKLPGRQFIQNACPAPWVYRGEGCAYAGAACFDANDNPVASLSEDVCGRRLSSCEARGNQQNFGGFASVGVYRR